MINDDQKRAIAFLVCAARPHGARQWDAAGVIAALAKVQNLALADVTAAAMRGAADRTLETPAAISNTSSSCWRERIAERTVPRNPTPATACWTCGKALSDTCCDAPSRKPRQRTDPAPHAAQARAALRGTP